MGLAAHLGDVDTDSHCENHIVTMASEGTIRCGELVAGKGLESPDSKADGQDAGGVYALRCALV